MKFRPCIDIHNGKVKQIVGGTLKDEGNQASENFVSQQDAAFYARLYRNYKIRGGHIILLNPADSEYYQQTRAQAMEALAAYPGGLMVGGGIHPGNAAEFLDAGASHVIVTSYVFKDGKIDWEKLESLVRTVGREHLVLDLSCRKREGRYYIVTDRWQKFTEVAVTPEVLETLKDSCDEFLIHAVEFSDYLCRGRGQLCRFADVTDGRQKSVGCNNRQCSGPVRWDDGIRESSSGM